MEPDNPEARPKGWRAWLGRMYMKYNKVLQDGAALRPEIPNVEDTETPRVSAILRALTTVAGDEQLVNLTTDMKNQGKPPLTLLEVPLDGTPTEDQRIRFMLVAADSAPDITSQDRETLKKFAPGVIVIQVTTTPRTPSEHSKPTVMGNVVYALGNTQAFGVVHDSFQSRFTEEFGLQYDASTFQERQYLPWFLRNKCFKSVTAASIDEQIGTFVSNASQELPSPE